MQPGLGSESGILQPTLANKSFSWDLTIDAHHISSRYDHLKMIKMKKEGNLSERFFDARKTTRKQFAKKSHTERSPREKSPGGAAQEKNCSSDFKCKKKLFAENFVHWAMSAIFVFRLSSKDSRTNGQRVSSHSAILTVGQTMAIRYHSRPSGFALAVSLSQFYSCTLAVGTIWPSDLYSKFVVRLCGQ